MTAHQTQSPEHAATDTPALSCLDAAAVVLADAEAPMTARDLVTAMAERKLWTSSSGKTPHATVYAGMFREIHAKGDQSASPKPGAGSSRETPDRVTRRPPASPPSSR